ncbi:hypothetical protein ACHAPD_002418 [Fusarium lateritium]
MDNFRVPTPPPHEEPLPLSEALGVQRGPNVMIRDTFTNRGQGLFATRNLPTDHRIINGEDAVLSGHPLSLRPKWNDLTHRKRDELKQIFRNLRAIPTEGTLSSRPMDMDHVRLLENFRQEYGFQDPQGRRCHFYKTACFINHACGKCAQASFQIDGEWPYRINVKLNEPVRADEEIFIHYGKKKLPYGCAVCTKKETTSFGGRLMNKLRKLLRRNREE